MATNTTKLGLIKPDLIDIVDIADLNNNADDIDAAVGAAIVTSSTRPSVPWVGQIIFETDTDKTLVWGGTAWEEISSLPTNVVTPSAGQKLVFDGTNWVNLTGYVFVSTVYFTSSGTFTKADYPWLRAIRVKVQGGGGGGGGVAAASGSNSSVSGGGGGGAYGEKFITDIAGLDSSVTVTVGAGGSAGAAGNNAGSAGGNSSFGAVVSANGGVGGPGGAPGTGARFAANGTGSDTAAGVDFKIGGGGGNFNSSTPTTGRVESGGTSFLGSPANGISILTGPENAGGPVARGYGAGGSGAVDVASNIARAGSAGTPGILIVELYA
jgi:hypothetical protein